MREARNEVSTILVDDVPQVMKNNNMEHCICLTVPRAKAFNTYSSRQLMFREAVSLACQQIPRAIDGTDFIMRIENTRTTHLRDMKGNDGDLPYPGITQVTCQIDTAKIRNHDIILIDDIYTRNINIDEDCIQALLNHGARRVIFYAVAFTRRQQ